MQCNSVIFILVAKNYNGCEQTQKQTECEVLTNKKPKAVSKKDRGHLSKIKEEK